MVFGNILNGVRIEQIMGAFQMSAKEVMDDFAWVGKKVRSYQFERGMPMTPCDTVENAKANRVQLAFILSRLNLDKEPKFKIIHTGEIDIGQIGAIAAQQGRR